MAHLFATLPAESNHDIPAKVVANARRLSMEFQAYVVRAHALRKVFVSVKGFYYQADIQGQAVTWLVPHNLAQASAPLILHFPQPATTCCPSVFGCCCVYYISHRQYACLDCCKPLPHPCCILTGIARCTSVLFCIEGPHIRSSISCYTVLN